MSAKIPSTPVAPVSSPSRWPARVSWLLILGLAGIVVYGNARVTEESAQVRMLEDQRARMFGLLVVQLKSLEKSGGSPLIRERIGVLVKQLEEDSRSTADKLRLAMLVGETAGAEEAIRRLSSIVPAENEAEAAEDIRSLRTIYTIGARALLLEEREQLIRRHGYVGRLALVYGMPSGQEPRRALESEAFWFTLKLSLLGGLLAAVMILSVIAFTIAVVWFFRGKLHREYAPETTSNSAYLEGFALYLVLFLGLGVVIRLIGSANLQLTWIALIILPIVWGWLGLRGMTARQRVQALGWHRGKGVIREVGAGVVGYIAGLVVIAVGILITVVLIQLTDVRTSSPVVQELTRGPWRLLGIYALACIFAPLTEETMFRGVLFHHMRGRWSWLASAAVVSMIFALLHPQGWVAAPALSAIAMVLAALREWRGSLIAPMTAHACSNFLVLTMALLLIK